MSSTPSRSASQRAIVDLPQPIGPVSPMRSGRPRHSRGPFLQIQPRIFRCSERRVHVRELTRHPSQFDEAGRHRRITQREFQMVLAQAKAGQLGIQGAFWRL